MIYTVFRSVARLCSHLLESLVGPSSWNFVCWMGNCMTMDNSKYDDVGQDMQRQPLEYLPKTDNSRTHYVAVTHHRVIKLAHRRCIGPAVILWLAVGLTNWLTAVVQIHIEVGDLQNKISNKSDTNTDHYATNCFGWQIRHWQSLAEFLEHCFFVHTNISAIASDSHFSQTGCQRTKLSELSNWLAL